MTGQGKIINPDFDPKGLLWPMTMSIVVLLILCIGLHYYYAWAHKRKKKTSPKETFSIAIDEGEGGDAKYLISIVTSSNYEHCPTAVTSLHLIGRFPGRIHDIYPMKEHSLFEPLSLLKVVVLEDVDLDPIIAIVLKTNQAGPFPTWNCNEVIVRNLDTNSAWLFKINSTIGFSKCFQCVPPDQILGFRPIYQQRRSQEDMQGLRAYTGIYGWSPLSAYTAKQRIFLSITTHFLTFNLTIICFSFIFKYLQLIKYPKESIRYEFLHDVHGSLWLSKIIPTALLSGFISSLIAYFVNKLFREKGTYEIFLSETDHYVATALRQSSETLREKASRMKMAVETLSFEQIVKRESKARGIIALHAQHEHTRPGVEDDPSTDRLTPVEIRARWRRIFMGNIKKRKRRLASIMGPFHRRSILRKRSSAGFSGHFNIAPHQISPRPAKPSLRVLQYKRDGTTEEQALEYRHDALKPNAEDHNTSRKISVPKFVLPRYTGLNDPQHQRVILSRLPGELDPKFFIRPQTRPLIAWVLAMFLFLGGFAGSVTFVVLDCEELIADNGAVSLVISATFLTAIACQLIIFEQVKLRLVAYVLARNDLRLFRFIENRFLVLLDVRFRYQQTVCRTLFIPTLRNIEDHSVIATYPEV